MLKIRRADMNETIVEVGFEELNHRTNIAFDLVKLYKRNKFYINSNITIVFRKEILYKFKVDLENDYGPIRDYRASGILHFIDGTDVTFKIKMNRYEYFIDMHRKEVK